MWYKNKVAWCPICNQGWVQIWKDKTNNKLFVFCDECESLWEHPKLVKITDIAKLTFDTDFEICKPTEDEIKVNGWENYIIND
jgi:transcription elongation factor Elf1